MGQSVSTEEDNTTPKVDQDTNLESFTKEQLIEMFSTRCLMLLRPLEIKAITSKLNITNLKERNIVTPSDLAYLLQLSNNKDQDISTISDQFNSAVRLLYESFKVVGKFPFLQDYTNSYDKGLTVNDLVVTTIFHIGRYQKFLSSDFDYLRLVFISLTLPQIKEIKELKERPTHLEIKLDKPCISEDLVTSDSETFVVEVVKSATEEYSFENIARRIKWDTFKNIKSFDEIDVDSLSLNAFDFLQIVTLFLIILSVPMKKPELMQDHLTKNISERWSEFQVYGLCLIRFINVNINEKNAKNFDISFREFKEGINNGMPNLFGNVFNKLFKKGFISSLILQPELPKNDSMPKDQKDQSESHRVGGESVASKNKRKFPEFKESKLVNDASLSYISTVLDTLGSPVTITNQNLVKLYTGSESGFSIRSLESKIFKWQAPTLFVISGKRLKNKTITTNKRYQQFNTEYPRFFRSLENSKKHWQNDNDKITYAILVNQPWRSSNKRNFGDENTVIISISPRLDFYKSVHNSVHKGESIYFNNMGLGLGFGNGQPINRNGVKKYLPGDVSLTVEANLEFAVFRHLVTLTSNATSFFNKSLQDQASHEDFEDRFMITDLEVWGVGSTKELEEQRKQWQWEEKQAQARQSVNLKSLGEERAFLEMAGLIGNHNASGGSV